MTNPVATQVWPAFLDFPEVWGYLGYNRTPTTTDETLVRRYIDAACTEAQSTADRPFAPTQFHRRFNGWSGLNGAYIMLPYHPVLQVSSVTEWWGNSGPHVLSEQTPEAQTGQDVYQVDYAHGVVTRTFMGLVQRPWFPGSRNIEITWTAGYNPVPPDVWMATCELVGWWYRNTQEAARVSTFASNEYDAQAASGLWPGVPNRIADVFSRYRLPAIG